MSILSRLSWKTLSRGPVVLPASQCRHSKLVPRWDVASDIGIPEVVLWYGCKTCRSMFTPEEAKALGAV